MRLSGMLACRQRFPTTVHPSHLELRERHDREEDVEGGEEEDDGAERHGCSHGWQNVGAGRPISSRRRQR